MDNIGKIIQEYRKKKNLTQEELGKCFFVSKEVVSRWEKNRSMPDIDTLEKLAKFLEIPPYVLLGGTIREVRRQRKVLLILATVSFIISTVLIITAILVPYIQDIAYMKKIESGYEITDQYGYKNPANPYAENVTMVQLIATPERYDGKLIRVHGVGNLEFEGDYIALSKDDWAYYNNHRISISLSDRAIPYEEAQKYNGKYVLVEGIFEMSQCGFDNLGRIEKVSRYELTFKEEQLDFKEN